MKPVKFLGDSLRRLREFPDNAKQDAGYQLDQVQRGGQPDDFKPMLSVGKGVEELRVWHEGGTYRVIYLAGWPMQCMYCTPFKRKLMLPRNGILIWRRSATTI